MTKPKKTFILLVLFLFFSSCGYTPIFSLLSTVMDQEGGLDLLFNRESDIYDILFHSPDFGLIVFGNKGIFQKIRSINENQFQVIKLGR